MTENDQCRSNALIGLTSKTRLIAHSGADQPSVFDVPRHWVMGSDFDLSVNALILPRPDGTAAHVPILRFENVLWESEWDTDPASAELKIWCWAQLIVECRDEILAALLDHTVAKYFSLSLKANKQADVISDESISASSVSPEIVVFRPNSSGDVH